MRSTAAFVGRANESALLHAQVTQPGSATFVVGGPGMGKSRLVREVLDAAPDAHPLLGMSWQGDTASPYFPWIQIIAGARQLLKQHGLDAEALATDLGPLTPDRATGNGSHDGHLARDLLGMAATNYLAKVAESVTNPVLLIEDIHAADPDSIELAAWIVRQRLPLAVVATMRPDSDIAPGARDLLDSLREACTTISLEPLGRDDISALLHDQSMPHLNPDHALVETRGVPLDLHNWLDAKRSSGGASFRPSRDFRLPQLDEHASDLLQYAALIGNEFDVTTIAEVIGQSPGEVLDVLQAPIRLALIKRVEPTLTRFTFEHETIREELTDSIGATERAHRHQSILDVLLQRTAPNNSDIAILAHHAAFAAFVGDPDLAVRLNLEAGESALAHSAPAMARRHFDRAVELAELAGSETAVRIRAEIGAVRAIKAAASPDFERAITALLQRVSEPDAPDEAFVDTALLLPTNWSSLAIAPEPDHRTVVWLERALERVGSAPTKRRARVLIELSIHRRPGASANAAARELVDEALEIARRTEDIRLEAYIYSSVQWLSRSPGDITTILSKIDEFEARTGAGGNEAFVLSGVRITTLFRAGAFNLARRELDRLESTFSPLPPFAAWALGRWRAALLILRGDHAAGEVTSTLAFEHAKDSPFAGVAFEYLAMQLAVVMRDRIQMDAAEPMLVDMVAQRPDYAAYRAAYAWMLSDLGRHDEARRELAQLFTRDALWSDETVVEWMPLATMAATAAAELGEVEWCKEVVELLEPFKDEWIVWGTGIVIDGPVRLRRAHAATVAGDLETARDDLAVARQQITGAAARTFFPVLLHHEAQLARREGDLHRAVELATRASDSAADIGLDTAAEILAALAFELAEETKASPAPPSDSVRPNESRHGTLVRRGTTWTLSIAGDTSTFTHVKGLLALAELLNRPGQEIHVAELAAVIDGATRGASRSDDLSTGSSHDVLLDDQALREYKSRISHLEEELEEAKNFNDIERENRAQVELDFILDELRRSTGLGGRSRASTTDAERARVRVTKSLRTAISRVAEASPAMGDHLNNSVQTGSFCSYRPDGLNPIQWDVSTSPRPTEA